MEKIDFLKDEIRDIRLKFSEFVKKDDIDYRMLIEKTHKNGEQITELNTRLNNIEKNLDKNNALIESVGIQNVKSTSLLENISYQIDNINKNSKENNEDMSKDIKDLGEKVNRIDIETSKNTDNRLNTKQIVMLVITILISAIVGGVLTTPVP